MVDKLARDERGERSEISTVTKSPREIKEPNRVPFSSSLSIRKIGKYNKSRHPYRDSFVRRTYTCVELRQREIRRYCKHGSRAKFRISEKNEMMRKRDNVSNFRNEPCYSLVARPCRTRASLPSPLSRSSSSSFSSPLSKLFAN